MNELVHFSNSKYGLKATVTAKMSPAILEILLKHKIAGLELNDGYGWEPTSLNFLSNFPDLLSLKILSFKFASLGDVNTLHHLRQLVLWTNCNHSVDFTNFPDLEDCVLSWRNGCDSLFKCKSLKYIFLDRYSSTGTNQFKNIPGLESVGILNSPILNLHGLSFLSNLKKIRLANLSKLKSLSGIENLVNLLEVDINSCKGIDSLIEISRFTNLKRLCINNCGIIQSLTPLKKLKSLELLCFTETTDILDGDLSVILSLPKLQNVAFKQRSKYSHKLTDFPQSVYQRTWEVES